VPDPKPAVALEYFKRFRQKKDPEILLEFLEKHPLEFECSGWVCTAFGYIAMGYPWPSRCQSRAQGLFKKYWRFINHPPLSLAEISAIVDFANDRAKFSSSAPHKQQFQMATLWLAQGCTSI